MKIEQHKTSAVKKVLFLVPLALLTVSALANIIMAASISDVGARIHEYESKTAIISTHSDELMTELASKQSLAELKSWALTAGFVPRGAVTTIEIASPKLARAMGL